MRQWLYLADWDVPSSPVSNVGIDLELDLNMHPHYKTSVLMSSEPQGMFTQLVLCEQCTTRTAIYCTELVA